MLTQFESVILLLLATSPVQKVLISYDSKLILIWTSAFHYFLTCMHIWWSKDYEWTEYNRCIQQSMTRWTVCMQKLHFLEQLAFHLGVTERLRFLLFSFHMHSIQGLFWVCSIDSSSFLFLCDLLLLIVLSSVPSLWAKASNLSFQALVMLMLDAFIVARVDVCLCLVNTSNQTHAVIWFTCYHYSEAFCIIILMWFLSA